MSHVSQITTNGTIFTQASFSVSNEISLILVTRFLGKNYQKLEKKFLGFRPKKVTRMKKRRRREISQVIAKFFASLVNATKMQRTQIHFPWEKNW